MGSTRSSALIQIMRIEDQIKKVMKSKRYRLVQQNIAKLDARTGKAIIEIEPLDDEKAITVRRGSTESKEVMEKNRNILNEYETLLSELGKKKRALTTTLF